MNNPQRIRRCALAFALVAVAWSGAGLAQEADNPAESRQSDHPWGPLALLEGAWTGAIDGKLGTGKGVRRYEFVLGGKFLMSRHISVRLPQEKSPEGDEHEELGVFSYDSERETLVLREFMGEGVVVTSPCAIDDMTVVCESESVESGPGIRARLTLTITDRYRFAEKYEIAWSEGQELEHYFSNEWTRAPRPVGWD
jgi:hypothetical protein